MKLYLHPFSPNCRHPLATALHLGMDVETHVVDLLRGEARSPDYLAINPNGMVPALTDGDFRLFESNAICLYLARVSGKEHLVVPSDARRSALHSQWLSWRTAHFSPCCSALTWENFFKPLMRKEEPDSSKVEEATGSFWRFAAVLDNALTRGPYLLGDSLTIADFSLASPLMFAGPAKIPVEEFAHLRAWYDRVAASDAWARTGPPPSAP
jgi:glutathione S-transferase